MVNTKLAQELIDFIAINAPDVSFEKDGIVYGREAVSLNIKIGETEDNGEVYPSVKLSVDTPDGDYYYEMFDYRDSQWRFVGTK